jgi:hypothetical protein
VPIPWKRILEYVSDGTTVRGIWIKNREEDIPNYVEIAKMYLTELIDRDKGSHPDPKPECKRDRRAAPHSNAPPGGNLMPLMEPCGAKPDGAPWS